MSVIAKFNVQRIGTEQYSPTGEKIYQVKLTPVYGGADASAENKMFWKWSPSGEIVLNVTKEEIVKPFLSWGEFYVYFEKLDGELAPDDLVYKVTKLGNEQNDGDAKLYNVELRGHKGAVVGYGNQITLNTINPAAAQDFLGFGLVKVRFQAAQPGEKLAA